MTKYFKILAITIITIVIVGTTPVSAWSPFEHSSKDWDWKDWALLGTTIGVGLLLLGAGIYKAYKAYNAWQQNRITPASSQSSVPSISSRGSMAQQWIKGRGTWMTKLLDIHDFSDSDTQPGIELLDTKKIGSLFGVHTIEFKDGSRAYNFEDISKMLKYINDELRSIPGDAKARELLVKASDPLAFVSEFINIPDNGVVSREVTVVSTLRSIVDVKGMKLSFPVAKETFSFKNVVGVDNFDLFGEIFWNHIIHKSAYVTYNQFVKSGNPSYYRRSSTNQYPNEPFKFPF